MANQRDRIEVVPAMRGGVRPQTYMVSREYAEILVANDRAYWDPCLTRRIYEKSIMPRGIPKEWRKVKSGYAGPSVMQMVPINLGRRAR